jgi:hypothetical protein
MRYSHADFKEARQVITTSQLQQENQYRKLKEEYKRIKMDLDPETSSVRGSRFFWEARKMTALMRDLEDIIILPANGSSHPITIITKEKKIQI